MKRIAEQRRCPQCMGVIILMAMIASMWMVAAVTSV